MFGWRSFTATWTSRRKSSCVTFRCTFGIFSATLDLWIVSNAEYTSARGPDEIRPRMRYLPSFWRALSNAGAVLTMIWQWPAGAGRHHWGSPHPSQDGARLQHLEQAGGAHAAADAHRADHELGVAALALDQRVADVTRTGHALGMPDRECGTVDVQELVRDAEPVPAVDHLHGEGLVQLPEPDVIHPEPGPLQELRHREHGPDTHLVRLRAGHGHGAVHAERLEAAFLGEAAVHEHGGGGAVGELARVAGRDRAALAHGLQAGKRLEGGVRAVALVARQRLFDERDLLAVPVADRHARRDGHDLVVEGAAALGVRRPLLALQGVLVLAL